MPRQHVIVIGAGMGGLSSALRLAHQGCEVTVLEASGQPGGKVHAREVAGALIDSGPTVFTMRWVFDELLREVGTDLEAELQVEPLAILARHFWTDGSSLDLSADAEASEAAIADWAGPEEAQRFRQFCSTARRVYDTLEDTVIRAQRPSLMPLIARLGPSGLGVLASLGPLRSLWHSMGRQFTDPRLRQLFGRYATYCGSSPWQAPATLMLIAQVEMNGVWSVRGGMTALSAMLARLAEARGAHLRYHSRCASILQRDGRVTGVRLDNGEELRADAIVFNGDVAALRAGLLSQEMRAAVPRAAPPRSLSALTWSIHAPVSGVALERHNVFFCDDYAREFDDIFGHHRLPLHPTVYVCAQDRPGVIAGGAAQRLFCLVNAPAMGDDEALDHKGLASCESNSFQLLRQLGLKLERTPQNCVRTTPWEFHRRFPATGGALYGQATHGWSTIFSRPGAVTPLRGLYLAGGSVHPGPGVPMAAMSGRLAAAAVLENLGSTSVFQPTAISGGISTPSATIDSTA
ncbi:MAG: 1-hydroxycarotenoid 3,4-desaturase CrtD [Curvibacter sp.]|jgi:1-hydroxycarotenoid 3,4-desaturase|nr:phytoene desaturase [Curvibacter sp.]